MNERGISVTLDYILMLMIATILLAGIVAVSGSLIDGQVDQGIDSELRTAGETLAVELQEVQRLVSASDDETTIVSHTPTLPTHVSGHTYTIAIDDGSTILLEADRPGTTVRVSTAASDLQPTDEPVRAGDVRIAVTGGTIKVVAG